LYNSVHGKIIIGKNIVFIFVPMDLDTGPLFLTFWDFIAPVDRWLIVHINQNWSNGVLDAILPFFRESAFWMPLYLFLIVFMLMNFRKQAGWWILGFALSIAFADLISSNVIKLLVFRLRPCQDMEVAHQLRFFINYCPKSSSFTSSHATSFFAQASFLFLTWKKIWSYSWVFFIWAGTIAYTQVYVGVHYPFDVVCGALLGTLIGSQLTKIFHNRAGMLSLVN